MLLVPLSLLGLAFANQVGGLVGPLQSGANLFDLEVLRDPVGHPRVARITAWAGQQFNLGPDALHAYVVGAVQRYAATMAKAGGQVVCVLIASDKEVSLKKLASAAGTKDAAMLPPAEAERITGYHVGGISPLGQRKRVRVFIEAAAMAHPTIIFNGGRRGLQIEIAPQELVKLLAATPADL